MKQKIQYYKLRQTLINVPTSDEIISLQGKYKKLSALVWIEEIISSLELSINDVYHCQGIVKINVEECKKSLKIHNLNTKNGKNTRINQKIKQILITTLGLNSGNKGYSFTLFSQKSPEIYKEYCCKDYTDLTYIAGEKEEMLKYRKMYYTRQEVKTQIKNNTQKEKRDRRQSIIENYKTTCGGKFNSSSFIKTLIKYYEPTQYTLSRNLINCHYDDILKIYPDSYRKIITKRICDTCDLSYHPLIANRKCQLTSGMLSIQEVIDFDEKDDLDDENINETL
jgi:hypothetical protein